MVKHLSGSTAAAPPRRRVPAALSCSAAARCNLVSARGLHMILSPRSARLVPRDLTRAPPSARFKEVLACVGKCGSVSVQSDSQPAWELFNNKRTVLFP